MNSWFRSATVTAITIAVLAPALQSKVAAQDLREAVPSDMFLAVHGKHNPERDYQREHYQAVWDTVEQSRIIERVTQIIQSRMSESDVEQMLAFRDRLKEAVSPIKLEELAELNEVVYAQKMEGPFTQNVLMMRFPEGTAASLVEGLGNLLDMAGEAASELRVEDQTAGDAKLRSLVLPPGVPMSPTIGVRGDLFLYSSNPELLKQCLELLDNPSAQSKFDDPRLKAALTHLPEAEDAVVFFDGQQLNQQLDGLITFIRGVGAGNDEAQRIASLLESFLDEVQIVDHEVTVEYTDGYRNLSAAYGRYAAGYAEKTAGKMVAEQQAFSNWSRYVPADASGFSLSSGANLHPLYVWATTKIPELFPESDEFFTKAEAIQDEYDVHLDEDILQGFGGESVSVTMPGPMTPFGPSAKSVTMLRCTKPERITELINRGLDALTSNPQVQRQGVQVTPSAAIDGFQQISASFFMMMGGMTPTFGMQDGWLVMGTHADAIQSVLVTQGGESDTFAQTERFTQFGMEVPDEVHSISYSNIGETIRQISNGMQQAGAMLPMFMAMAGDPQAARELEPVKDVLSLLPTIGRIVGKFDFIDSRLSVSLAGPEEDSWIRHTVTTIRPPASASRTEE
jgi:hypothetical protein